MVGALGGIDAFAVLIRYALLGAPGPPPSLLATVIE
jgi:hypothetical protein